VDNFFEQNRLWCQGSASAGCRTPVLIPIKGEGINGEWKPRSTAPAAECNWPESHGRYYQSQKVAWRWRTTQKHTPG